MNLLLISAVHPSFHPAVAGIFILNYFICSRPFVHVDLQRAVRLLLQ
jgi:hypothetical protein